jgi:DNA-binding NarL/FixJ family response regulator
LRLLIVDDSDLIVQRLAPTLRQIAGVEIIGRARTAQEAAAAVRSLNPDVVILDIALPGGSGLDVLEGMTRDASNALVIVLTNHPYAAYRKKCAELGCSYFFDKSAEFEKVGEVLRRLIKDASAEAVRAFREMDVAGPRGVAEGGKE